MDSNYYYNVWLFMNGKTTETPNIWGGVYVTDKSYIDLMLLDNVVFISSPLITPTKWDKDGPVEGDCRVIIINKFEDNFIFYFLHKEIDYIIEDMIKEFKIELMFKLSKKTLKFIKPYVNILPNYVISEYNKIVSKNDEYNKIKREQYKINKEKELLNKKENN